jgi:hypothetical protein
MTIASDLLQQHIQTLVADNARWQTLIADDLVWELPYGPGIGDPARLAGREEVMRHVTWFLGAVENVRFFDLQVHAFAVQGGGRRGQSGGVHQADAPHLQPAGTWCSSCRGRQDRVSAGILRPHACSQGDEQADSRPQI